ncbi:MAG: NAD(+)/NADH kinase [Actinomycetota bacterium]|nr:NAD(+)/NADH kinase [Actinomycetota bacterium]
MRRLGLIVNPLAGVGGRLAFKGSDDRGLVDQALNGGAARPAPDRARAALAALPQKVEVLAAGGAMGADLAGTAITEAVAESTAADTRAAAIALADAGVDLLLFAGGDGTAVDVLAAVGDRLPVIGIPAGVKMHSAVFGVNPRSAGELAAAFVAGRVRGDAPGEVMDIEESDLRAGLISPRLHGFLRVPVAPGLVQGGKARSAPAEAAAQAAVAAHAVELLDGATALIGPGTTTRAVMAALGLPKSLLGVDVVQGDRLLAADADEETLLGLAGPNAIVIVTPVGGQGFVLGRGNQQISPAVLWTIGVDRLLIVATEAKLAALGGRPLLVDTGDTELDAALAGYRRVVTGYRHETVYRVTA